MDDVDGVNGAGRVVEGLYDAALQPTEMAGALRQLADHVGGHSALLVLTDASYSSASGFLSQGSDPRLLRPECISRNPWVRAALRQPPGTLLLTHRLVPRAELSASPFFAEVVCPCRIEHGLGCVSRGKGESAAFLVVHRSAGEGPFDEDAIARCRELIPGLERTCRIALGLARARQGWAAALTALHRLRIAVAVVGADRRVRFANRSAERALGGTSVLAVHDGRLVARTPAETQELERLIAAAVGQHTAGATTLQGPKRRAIELMVVPMDSVLQSPAPSALVLFRNPDEPPSGIETLLEQLYRLTPTEARVARAIMRGEGLQRCAKQLGMRPSTARTHLYRVFDKTGTRRQAELVRLLLDGPALLSDWRS